MKIKEWKCDYEGCTEIAQWYRKWKGKTYKLCTKHNVQMNRERLGRHVDILDEDDMRSLEEKVLRDKFTELNPFEVIIERLKDGTIKARIKDKQTNETRSFIIMDSDFERLNKTYGDLEIKKSLPKPSIDEYIKSLRNGISNEKRPD